MSKTILWEKPNYGPWWQPLKVEFIEHRKRADELYDAYLNRTYKSQ